MHEFLQFRDSCLDVCSEFTKIDLQWQLDHPEEVNEDVSGNTVVLVFIQQEEFSIFTNLRR